MKRLAVALLLVAGLPACKRHGSGAPTPAPSPVAPGSGQVRLVLAKSDCDQDQEDCACKGSVDDPQGMKELGLGTGDLDAGITCFSGDFDGNGTKDWAITGKGYLCDPDGPKDVKTRLRVLLLDHDDRLVRALTVDTADCAASQPVGKGDFPGIASDRDGIEVQDGDGFRIWYFDGTRMTSAADDAD